MFAGIIAPVYAFALFLPTIINQVPADVANSPSLSMLTPNRRLGTALLPLTYSSSPSTSLLLS